MLVKELYLESGQFTDTGAAILIELIQQLIRLPSSLQSLMMEAINVKCSFDLNEENLSNLRQTHKSSGTESQAETPPFHGSGSPSSNSCSCG